MSDDLRAEVEELRRRSEELRKGSARCGKEAEKISRRLMEIQDEFKARKAKKTSDRLG